MKTVDYLIIGQGIAGSVLADHLLKKNKKIQVLNQYSEHSSSMVAAGIINPITGRKMIKTWYADKLFSYLFEYYLGLEKELKTSFCYIKSIYRPFISAEEYNECMGKSADKYYDNFIYGIESNNEKYPLLKSKHGGISIKKSGYLDIPTFLKAFQSKLVSMDAYSEEEFEETKLKLEKDTVIYDERIKAKKIIFCTGVKSMNSTYFSWLPFRPVKGEVLEIESHYKHDVIFNRGVFTLPIDKNLIKVGATYNWKEVNNEISEEAKQILEEKLQELMDIQYTISKQYAGIRPATKDRHPFVGLHPNFSQVGIFNGLGAKGVSLAPYFAKEFVDALEGKGTVDKMVSIERYYSLLSNP